MELIQEVVYLILLTIVLIVLASVAAFLFISWQVALWGATHAYARMIKENVIEVDDFVGGPPNPMSTLKCFFYNWFNLHGCKPSTVTLDLCAMDSHPPVPQLLRNATPH